MSSISKTNDLSETILDVLKEKTPKTVQELTNVLKDLGFEERKVLDCVQKMQADGLVKLENDLVDQNISTYNRVGNSIWYPLTIAAAIITSILVFVIPPEVYPWAYSRNIMGVIFILFLPGYTLNKAVLRIKQVDKTNVDLEVIERIGLSIGLSIAIVTILGLLLYYSTFGLNFDVIVVTLLVFTSFFATIALIQENKTPKQIL